MGRTHQGTAGKPGNLRDRGWKGDTGILWLLLVFWLGGRDSGLLALLTPVPSQHPGNMKPCWVGAVQTPCCAVLSCSIVSDSDPMVYSLPASSVHQILQARTLRWDFLLQYWIAISSSRGSSHPRDQAHIACVSCTGRWILYHCAIWEAALCCCYCCCC